LKLRNRLPYLAAALMGTLAIASFVGLANANPSQDPDHLAGFLVFPGIVFSLSALALLTDSVAAWLIAFSVTGALVYVALAVTRLQQVVVDADPITYLIDVTAGGMVLVLVARAIAALRPIGAGER
jgi:hypothetical protein